MDLSIGKLKAKKVHTCEVCTNPFKIIMEGQLPVCSVCLELIVEGMTPPRGIEIKDPKKNETKK